MKSHVERCVISLYRALLEDFKYVHHTMDRELQRFDRLHSIIADRGLSFFTLTLPDACKYLERSLASGRLLDERPPFHGRKSVADVRPRFLWGLWSLVFDDNGMLRADPSIEAVFALRQLYLFAKKLRMECSDEKVEEAFSELELVDQSLPDHHCNTWDSIDPEWTVGRGHPIWGPSPRSTQDTTLPDWDKVAVPRGPLSPSRRWDKFRELCARVTLSLGECDVWAMKPKHGPGAVSDGETIKYELSHWPTKLERIFPSDWFGSYDLESHIRSNREFPCKVLAVPKTQKGPRIIASEPTAHQWIQGGIQRWFTRQIRASSILQWSIDLRDQEPSREMALKASIDGSYCTVDLSAASDRVSTRLVECVFNVNRDLLDALHASRSRLARLPSGRLIRLRKFAMMGSACTFPVQSIVFTCLALFSIMETENDYSMNRERLTRLAQKVRVFGDDIIVPAECYDALESILTDVLLKVNPHKSFWTGLFRESCGMDAFMGHDVTPAYFLQLYKACDPESLASITEVINNFHKKGCWNASDLLLKTIDPMILRKIIVTNRDVSQPRLFSFVGTFSTRQRTNRHLHREEHLALVLVSKVRLRHGSGNSAMLQYFSEVPDPLEEYQSGQPQRPSHRLVRRWVEVRD